ncbi:Metal-dependent hydrolases of the beta-lactamase superfamily III [Rhodovastum atsumiense]|uniref:Ribonuclease Z n=1 Tax=Rhodovastum atsumiense TaxID=504468 RepID=A0A5M6IU95_9PROT|nr:MBL fold metallo-hydrolase [Rhodovastum atsumiense]KAA5611118.1 ribonuclease Z [Rhodovastum atsumiense]CAH2599182.1 Metal-dependent hydrolases of the beta-lactamase superfamily III [Rhodovastum atsumiense]
MRPAITCSLVNGVFGDPVMYADLMFDRQALLFDMGDLRALPTRKLLRVAHAFVSHAHMDHFGDFDWLLRLLLGRETTLGLYGPPGFIDQVAHKLGAYTWNLIRSYAGQLVLAVTEVAGDGRLLHARFASATAFMREDLPATAGDVLLETPVLRVRCAVLDHGTPCLGFVLEETAHVNIWRNRLDARGLPVGPWLRELKQAILRGAPDETMVGGQALGTVRDLAVVVPGQRIAYVTDVRFTDANAARIVALARDADVLFIEAGFLDADAAQAARRNHLTAVQAGTLARRAGAKRLVPLHFSTRYSGQEAALRAEAAQAHGVPA